MIDQTTARIFKAKVENHQRKQRTERLNRLIALTDKVLWQLEEMNRDGLATLPHRSRKVIEEKVGEMPEWLRRMYCDDGSVQGALDSLFEMQQAIFKARHPEFDFGENDELELD